MDEYVDMFGLSPADLKREILGCADGPASFNAGMNMRGLRVVSVDPIYSLTTAQIGRRIEETFPVMMEQLEMNLDAYVWTGISSPDALAELRRSSMEQFLADFPKGKEEGRYLPGNLGSLPFGDGTFDLALCSHLLFLYSGELSVDFHRQAVAETLRVAAEIRIFPLQTLAGQESPHLEAVCAHIAETGRRFEIKEVDYEFQRGANRMLRAW